MKGEQVEEFSYNESDQLIQNDEKPSGYKEKKNNYMLLYFKQYLSLLQKDFLIHVCFFIF